MKKLLPLLFLVLGMQLTASAADSDLFSYDETAVSYSMTNLNELEQYVAANNVTFDDMMQNPDAVADFSLNNINGSSIPLQPAFSFEDMDWGAFAWGFCCWPIGIFTVLINKNKDSNSKISYFIGIGTAVLLSLPGYFLRYSYY